MSRGSYRWPVVRIVWALGAAVFWLVLASWVDAVEAQIDPISETVNAETNETVGRGEAEVTVALLRQSLSVAPRGTFEVAIGIHDPANQLGGRGAEEVLEAAVSFNAIVYTVLEDAEQLESEPTRPIHRLVGVAADVQYVDSQLVAALEFGVRDDDQNQTIQEGELEGERLHLPDPGVYPVVIELVHEGTVHQRFRTNLIRLARTDDESPQPTPTVAAVWVIGKQTGRGDDKLHEALRLAPNAPITAIIPEETATSWGSADNGAERWRASMAGRPAVPLLGEGVDPSALTKIGQSALYSRALVRARQQLTSLGFVSPIEMVAVNQIPTREAAAVLSAQGAKQAIVAGPPSVHLGLTGGNQGPITVVAPGQASMGENDGQLDPNNTFGATEPLNWHQTLAAWHLRARIKPQHFVLSNLDPTIPPEFWPFLFASAEAGVVKLSSVAEVQEEIRAAGAGRLEGDDGVGEEAGIDVGPLEELTYATTPPYDFERFRLSLGTLDEKLRHYRSSFIDSGMAPVEFERRALAVLAAGAGMNTDTVLVELDRNNRELIDEINKIDLSEDATVTVAAHITDIPIIIISRAEGSRNVRLRLRSDNVLIGEPERVVEVQPGSNTLYFEAEVRTFGTSSVEVVLETPDGGEELAANRLTVRSTAVPGLGLAIIVGGMGVLAIWWVVHHHNRRRQATVA